MLPIRIVNAPLWASYSDAHARHDGSFLRTTLKYQTGFAVVYAMITAGVLTASIDWIVGILSHQQLDVALPLNLALSAVFVLETVSVPFVIYMNGCGKLIGQTAATLFSLMTYFPVKIFILAHYGLPAMVWTTAAFIVFNAALFYFIIFRRDILGPLTDSNFSAEVRL